VRYDDTLWTHILGSKKSLCTRGNISAHSLRETPDRRFGRSLAFRGNSYPPGEVSLYVPCGDNEYTRLYHYPYHRLILDNLNTALYGELAEEHSRPFHCERHSADKCTHLFPEQNAQTLCIQDHHSGPGALLHNRLSSSDSLDRSYEGSQVALGGRASCRRTQRQFSSRIQCVWLLSQVTVSCPVGNQLFSVGYPQTLLVPHSFDSRSLPEISCAVLLVSWTGFFQAHYDMPGGMKQNRIDGMGRTYQKTLPRSSRRSLFLLYKA